MLGGTIEQRRLQCLHPIFHQQVVPIPCAGGRVDHLQLWESLQCRISRDLAGRIAVSGYRSSGSDCSPMFSNGGTQIAGGETTETGRSGCDIDGQRLGETLGDMPSLAGSGWAWYPYPQPLKPTTFQKLFAPVPRDCLPVPQLAGGVQHRDHQRRVFREEADTVSAKRSGHLQHATGHQIAMLA